MNDQVLQSATTTPSALPEIPGYSLHSQIGEGGYGYVYEAEQASTGQKVAIKMLKLADDVNEQKKKYQIARFERETQLCAEINHPHIVKLLDKGYSEEGVPYAVFELVEGETLKNRIIRNSGLSAEETGELMGQVLDALAAAHAKGIVHRDLKPHNIMVMESGTQPHIKILDFGIGAFTREFRSNDYQSLTLTREVMGTPAYSAPEQLRGEPATVKTDLYAWGLTVIECLTGQPVVKGESVAEVFQQQLNSANVPLPPAIAGHSLADLLRRVLHKNARLRSGDAGELYQDFKRINFSTLVGNIRETLNSGPDLDDDITEANSLAWQDMRSEKRQITVLCVKLNLVITDESTLDLETLDAIQKDQLNLVKDTAVRFGGHIAGAFGDNVMIYFGYPTVSDNDARRAGRTALELMSQIRRRSGLLDAQHGVILEVRMGMHSGTVLAKPNQTPEGMVPNVAINLLYSAASGTILSSDASKKLLDPYLEFDSAEDQLHSTLTLPAGCFSIVGERQTEALSFLRPWSANRDMVGRDVERDQVLNHWNVVQSGSGQSVILHGQAGIGKSKMIYEIKKQVRADGFQYREARCLPEHQNNALYPFLDMLRNHWGIAELNDSEQIVHQLETNLTAAGVDVKEGLPILCSWLSLPLTGGYEVSQATPDVQKQILFNLLEQSILHIGREKAFLLVLEDLHWLDPTGQEFVETLLKNLEGQPYLLLMTTRPVFVPEWKHDYLYDVNLEPLTENATGTLVEGVLNGKKIDEKALEYIADRTDGIPLYIEELTRMLVDENYLLLEAETYKLNEESNVQDIPSTLQDLLNARLDRMGPGKETAQLAATIGREFNYELLRKASLRDEASVQTDLEALMDADLVYRQRRVGDEQYIFRHALIRDAAYDGMVKSVRVDHHGRVAGTLKSDFPEVIEENPFEVARHLAGAEEYEEGSEFGVNSVKKMMENNANQEAIIAGESVSEWIKHVKGEAGITLKMELNSSLRAAHFIRGGSGSQKMKELADSDSELISSLSQEGTTPVNHELKVKALQSKFANFSIAHTQSKNEEAQKIGEELLEDAHALGARDVVLGAQAFLGQSYFTTGKIKQAQDNLEIVVNNFDKELDADINTRIGICPYTFSTYVLAMIHLFKGEIGKAYQYIHDMHAYSKKIGNVGRDYFMYTLSVPVLGYNGDLEKCKNFVDEAEGLYGETLEQIEVVKYFLMVRDWLYGETERSETIIPTMLVQSHALGAYEIFTVDSYIQKQAFFGPKGAKELLGDSIERQMSNGERAFLPLFLEYKAFVLCQEEAALTPGVEEILKASIAEAQEMGLLFFELRTRIRWAEIALQYDVISCYTELLEALEEIQNQFDEIQDFGFYDRFVKVQVQLTERVGPS